MEDAFQGVDLGLGTLDLSLQVEPTTIGLELACQGFSVRGGQHGQRPRF